MNGEIAAQSSSVAVPAWTRASAAAASAYQGSPARSLAISDRASSGMSIPRPRVLGVTSSSRPTRSGCRST